MSKRPAPPQSGTWGHVILGSTTLRPFLVVEYTPDTGEGADARPAIVGGWLFHNPRVDMHDALLREAGIAVQDRTRPCYLSVPISRWRLR